MPNQFPLIFVVSKIPISHAFTYWTQSSSGQAQSNPRPSPVFFKLDPVQLQAEPPRVFWGLGKGSNPQTSTNGDCRLGAPHKWATGNCPYNSRVGLGTDPKAGVSNQVGNCGMPLRSVAQAKKAELRNKRYLPTTLRNGKKDNELKGFMGVPHLYFSLSFRSLLWIPLMLPNLLNSKKVNWVQFKYLNWLYMSRIPFSK